jgi:hypothetical protein
LRRLVPHVEVFGPPNARSARVLKAASQRLPLMFVRLSSIRKFSVVPAHCRGAVRPAAHFGDPPSGPAFPSLGEVYFFASLSPEALAEGRSRLFDGRHGLCPYRDRESRSMSPTIFEARGPRLIKRSLPIASARRRTARRQFPAEMQDRRPPADRSVASRRRSSRSVNERVVVFRSHDLSLRNSVRLYEPRQKCRLLHTVATITPVL